MARYFSRASGRLRGKERHLAATSDGQARGFCYLEKGLVQRQADHI